MMKTCFFVNIDGKCGCSICKYFTQSCRPSVCELYSPTMESKINNLLRLVKPSGESKTDFHILTGNDDNNSLVLQSLSSVYELLKFCMAKQEYELEPQITVDEYLRPIFKNVLLYCNSNISLY